jgi:ribonuclease T1
MKLSLRSVTLSAALFASTLALLPAGNALARTVACPVGGVIAVNELPKQGKETLDLIAAGGPFSSNRDGISFSNRERILPKAQRGYYREYTVRTPGVKSRGARRIVCGGDQRALEACYYSDDHYQSFKCIAR